ncbi:MAG: hypothetical protein RL228_1115 [Actinomycetota bacterium]
MGVGEIARRLVTLLSASGLELNLIPFTANSAPNSDVRDMAFGRYSPVGDLISCVNADQLGALISILGVRPSAVHRHIGFWAWELEQIPEVYKYSANLLDEIWTISNHAKNAITKISQSTVKKIPIPVPIPKSKTILKKRDFGLASTGFIVLVSFDYNSDIRRKNPSGAIQAFKEAFPRRSDATLVIKTINAERFPHLSEALAEEAGGRDDIVFVDGNWSKYHNDALLENADIFLSLHRAEGYGINMADAMARKTAVIATGYSGNLDYMNDNSAILVPYGKVGLSNYAGQSFQASWAEPDVNFAAHALKDLYEKPSALQRLSVNGFEKIRNDHSIGVAASIFSREFLHE